jgi:hypothetical protein
MHSHGTHMQCSQKQYTCAALGTAPVMGFWCHALISFCACVCREPAGVAGEPASSPGVARMRAGGGCDARLSLVFSVHSLNVRLHLQHPQV